MTNNRAFTEAVPLSLSSMAHMTMPLEEGVADGLAQVVNHLLLSCVNYARAVRPPHDWTFQDLTTSQHAWKPHRGDGEPSDLPASLTKHGFQHHYHRTAFIYLRDSMENNATEEEEAAFAKDWSQADGAGILGKISLMFATTALMTPGELNGTEADDDTPKCIMYKAVVEYRSVPATGNKSAVQAEELSMLSFGGSVDDDVKFGALASLYDEITKYILEIYSVRGKKYKFDLMNSTLCNGSVPRLRSRNPGDDGNNDPFLKSLCVTVTDHGTPPTENRKYAITRIHLTMDGNLRMPLNKIPRTQHLVVAQKIQETFICLQPSALEMVTATPSGHTLLLDAKEAGKVYVNGRYVTTWGKDPKIGSHFPALFGMDLHSVPYWHGRIFDYDVLKRSYAQLWQDILTDARVKKMDVAGKLLSRLITGKDSVIEDDEDEDVVDEDEDDDNDDEEKATLLDTGLDCLESQVIQSLKYDPVGISAKALATKFKFEYGEVGFPCLAHEIDWVKNRLPGRVPVSVPLRVINVLRRGGYYDTKRSSEEFWFSKSRPAAEGEESEVVQKAVALLKESGCKDVLANSIVFVSGDGISDPVQKKGLVRYNQKKRQYHVNEYFSSIDLVELSNGRKNTSGIQPQEKRLKNDNIASRAYLLGFHIAQEHTDGAVLIRYLLQYRNMSI